MVIGADQQMMFVFFIYGDIEWGDGANIGFNAGDGIRSFMDQRALTTLTVNIDDGSNVDTVGWYIYRIDLSSIIGPSDGKKPKQLVVLITSWRLITVVGY